MKKIFSLFLVTTLLWSCGSTQKGHHTASTDQNEKSVGTVTSTTKINKEEYMSDSLLIRIELGACFGRCPIEKFSIFADGSFKYEGVKFVNKIGLYEGSIKAKEVDEIYTLMGNLKIDEYPEKFGYGVSDISTKAIIFNYNGKRKTIIFRQYEDYIELKEFISRVRGIMAGGKYVPAPYKKK